MFYRFKFILKPLPSIVLQQLYARLSELLGLGDYLLLLNVIVGKIATNLKCYTESEEVIDHTLSLFLELASGYMTGKLLLKLDTVKFLVANHTVFVSLESTPDAMFRSDAIKYVLIGLMRDLRGIAMATNRMGTLGDIFLVLGVAAQFSLSVYDLELKHCIPPPEIRDIVDGPPLPALSFSPHRDKVLFLKRRALLPLAEQARPEEKLAGLRIDGKVRAFEVGNKVKFRDELLTPRWEWGMETPNSQGEVADVDANRKVQSLSGETAVLGLEWSLSPLESYFD